MDITNVRKPLTTFIQQLPEAIQVDKVIIFGSYMHGTATKDSDIDVIVVSDTFIDMDSDDRMNILYDAADHIEPPVHAWGLTNEELKKASRLTTWGDARLRGIRFV